MKLLNKSVNQRTKDEDDHPSIQTEEVQGPIGSKKVGTINQNFYNFSIGSEPSADEILSRIHEEMGQKDNHRDKIISTNSPILIDVNDIAEFDLRKATRDFEDAIGCKKGVFGFIIQVPCPHLCRKYVLKRFRNIMRNKRKSYVEHLEFHLGDMDLVAPEAVFNRFENSHGPITYWLSEMPVNDFMLSVWGYGAQTIQGAEFVRIMNSFCSRVQQEYDEFLLKAGQCIVLIGVSLYELPECAESENFCWLELPESFNKNELEAFFDPLLKKAGLQDTLVQSYLSRLVAFSEIDKAFKEMTDIVDELKKSRGVGNG